MEAEGGGGLILVVYGNNKWYLAVTLQTFPDTEEVKVSCLEPAGPAQSFVYPQTQDILVIPASDVLTLVDPLTSSTARCYRLSDTESLKASRALQLRLSSSLVFFNSIACLSFHMEGVIFCAHVYD